MLSLQQIRSSFIPYTNHRWDVEFNVNELRILNNIKFPAKGVTFNPIEIGTETIAFRSGMEMEIPVSRKWMKSIGVTFYETNKLEIFKFIKTYYEKHNTDIWRGIHPTNSDLTVTITEYDRDGSEHRKGKWVVLVTNDYQQSLDQDASVDSMTLELSVLGTLMEWDLVK